MGVNNIYLIAAGIAVVIIAVVIILYSRRGNAKIYAMIDGDYRLVRVQRVSARAPVIDLSRPKIGGKGDEFMLVMAPKAARAMKGRPVKIIGKDGAVREQSIAHARQFRISSLKLDT